MYQDLDENPMVRCQYNNISLGGHEAPDWRFWCWCMGFSWEFCFPEIKIFFYLSKYPEQKQLYLRLNPLSRPASSETPAPVAGVKPRCESVWPPAPRGEEWSSLQNYIDNHQWCSLQGTLHHGMCLSSQKDWLLCGITSRGVRVLFLTTKWYEKKSLELPDSKWRHRQESVHKSSQLLGALILSY